MGSSHSVRKSDLRTGGVESALKLNVGHSCSTPRKEKAFPQPKWGTRKQRGETKQNPQGMVTQVLSEPQSRSCRPCLRPGGEQQNPLHVLNGGTTQRDRAPHGQNV